LSPLAVEAEAVEAEEAAVAAVAAWRRFWIS